MIGQFAAVIYELETVPAGATLSDVSQVLETDELGPLADLLARDSGHAQRIAAGDQCLVHRDSSGDLMGLLWLNLFTHTDRYLGNWSRPDASSAYYNQLMVHPGHRRKGVGRTLVESAACRAHAAGRSRLRAAVLKGNTASADLHSALGFDPAASFSGIRVGPITVRVPTARGLVSSAG